MTAPSQDELLFFDRRPGALPLYEALRRALFQAVGDVTIQVKKTQISFVCRRLFGAASFTPVRRAKERPDPFLTVTFGLGYPVESPRIDARMEAYPGRWTHHVLIGQEADIDQELVCWLQEAASFAEAKR